MSKTRILIVEDDADSACGITHQLEHAGYECVAVASRGKDAIEAAERLRPDLVLMDVELAGPLDGITAAARIRELLQIPVVFLTSLSDEAILERSREADPFGYIVKPFEMRELQPAIEIALHKHRTEAALRRSEERFRRLFHGVRDAVVLADAATGCIVEANEEACRLFGLPRESLVGRHQSELHPADKADLYRRLFQDYVRGSTAISADAEIISADGRTVPVEINAGLVDLGDRPAVLGVFRDISARRAAEQAARERQARLDAIFRAAPVGIGVLVDRVMTEVNDHVTRMTGYEREELLGRSTRMLYESDEAFESVDARKYGLIPEQGTGTLEARWRCRDGRMIDILMSSTPIIPGDLASGVIITAVDITETRRLNEQLMRAQRMESIGTLASGIAHDLNNVLAPITMSLGMLTEMVRDPSAHEMIETMQLAANRGADIVRQVLTFARGLGGERVEIQPRHMVQEIVRIARETFPRSIEVHSDFARDLPPILGDPTQIQQVLMNLSINARDAMPRGGHLYIHAAHTDAVPKEALPQPTVAHGGFVVFTVRDTGIGMAPEVRERIFDPFFTTKAVGQGTGLGLAVTLGIVERHGGAITVASEPGTGTTFQVFMPATQAGHEGEQQPPPPEARLPRGLGETILVVEDEPSVRAMMAGMLTKAGFKPVLARDGGEALLRLAECNGTVSLLVTDLMMPGMDGLELIPRIRQARPGIPVIAMTGLGDDDVRTSARALGVDRILAKPFSNAALLWAVSELIESRPAPRT